MRYLVATDGSDESDDAVRYAAEHAATFGATLEIVHVLTPETRVLDDELVVESRYEATEEGRETLERAGELAANAVSDDLDVELTLLSDRPADAITDRAEEVDADAIFIGHRGLSTEREEVVGSVAKSVVSKASTPVTVVR